VDDNPMMCPAGAFITFPPTRFDVFFIQGCGVHQIPFQSPLLRTQSLKGKNNERGVVITISLTDI
jgi:hypothetical protein